MGYIILRAFFDCSLVSPPLPHVQLVIFRILAQCPFCIVYGVLSVLQLENIQRLVAMSKRKAPQGDNPNKDICDMLMGEVNLLL